MIHDTTSSLTQFTLPDDSVIRSQTGKVFQQNGWTRGRRSAGPWQGRPGAGVGPGRGHVSSTIKHVFAIVKENRTYDQVFGDMPQGNGDPSVTQFGENVTPNQHALASQFGLYDNTYDIGTNSAEGHNWLMQADDPEYRTAASTREATTPRTMFWGSPEVRLHLDRCAGGREVRQGLRRVPVVREQAGRRVLAEPVLRHQEHGGDRAEHRLPHPNGFGLSRRSTRCRCPASRCSTPASRTSTRSRSGSRTSRTVRNLNMFGSPTTTPVARRTRPPRSRTTTSRSAGWSMRSRTAIWKDLAIFVVEDDSQACLHHVDGHRAPIQIISPWAQHATVYSYYYSQINDQTRDHRADSGIYSDEPEGQRGQPDARAFTESPDFTPFKALPNRTSLTDAQTPPAAWTPLAPSSQRRRPCPRPGCRRPAVLRW